jgi:hypothetical protein
MLSCHALLWRAALRCDVMCCVPLLCVHSALRSILQRLSQSWLLARFVIDEVRTGSQNLRGSSVLLRFAADVQQAQEQQLALQHGEIAAAGQG